MACGRKRINGMMIKNRGAAMKEEDEENAAMMRKKERRTSLASLDSLT